MDGPAEGAREGAVEGRAVLGELVGPGVGVPVVGAVDGVELGPAVGLTEGLEVGPSVTQTPQCTGHSRRNAPPADPQIPIWIFSPHVAWH